MVPPDPPAPLAWQPEERVFGVTRVASTSVTPDDFLLTSSFGSGPYYSDTSPYSTPVNQVNFDPVGVEDQSSTFLTSNLSFDSNTADAALDLTQRWIPRIPLGLEYDLGLMFEGDPVTNNDPQTSDEVSWSSAPPSFDPPPTSDTIDPNLSLGRDVDGSFQTLVGPYTFTPVDILPPGLGIAQQEAGFPSENPFTFNSAGPAVGIDGSSYPGENIQVVELESPPCTASLPFEQQLTPSGPSPRPCKWKDEDGTVCEELITSASLPGHLAKHGIEKQHRGHHTTCHWDGCKRKKHMNRESIVRHIREVHLRLRRPSKRVFKALVYRRNTS